MMILVGPWIVAVHEHPCRNLPCERVNLMRVQPKLVLWIISAALTSLMPASVATADINTLKIYLLAGQSNMVGHGYSHLEGGNFYNIPSLEFLIDTPAYLDVLPAETYTFKDSLNASWLNQRDDVWGVHYRSRDRLLLQVEPTPTTNKEAWSASIMPLSPGFGGNDLLSTFGPELGMGTYLGNAMQSPVFLFKSDTGGTTLAEDWRPPSAVAARGGSVGLHYTNTINQFKSFLDDLDAELAANGVLDDYNNATGYEVAGFVWFQGWNEKFNNGAGEYAQNIVDLVHDVRASDARIPNDLGVVIPESSDQDAALNAGRAAAVQTLNAEIADSAVFFENNNMIGQNRGYGFSGNWGYHFNAKAENYLEIGWRTGQAIVELGFTGSETVGEPSLPADLTGNGFVDFQDLTLLLAHWNQSVGVESGNLVSPDSTPVNFQDLTALLAAWTGSAAAPQAALGEAVPEPSTLLLAMLAVFALSVGRWRRM